MIKPLLEISSENSTKMSKKYADTLEVLFDQWEECESHRETNHKLAAKLITNQKEVTATSGERSF